MGLQNPVMSAQDKYTSLLRANDDLIGTLAFEKRLLLCAKHTSTWMSVRGTTVTGTVLAATEY